VFNSLFATYRMQITADACMTRVATAWSVSSQTVQPLCILAGGLLAATSTRGAITAAVAVAASILLLPLRSIHRPPRNDSPRYGTTPPVAGRITARHGHCIG
jgi:hypothetical protein